VSDLTERVARAVMAARRQWYGDGPLFDHMPGLTKAALERDAAAAIREVLAALREPSEAVALAYWNEPASGPLTDYRRERTEERLGVMLDAFAREHGIEPAEGGTGP
jgi:hypothetical protein